MKLDIKVDSEMVEIVKSLKKAGCFFMLLIDGSPFADLGIIAPPVFGKNGVSLIPGDGDTDLDEAKRKAAEDGLGLLLVPDCMDATMDDLIAEKTPFAVVVNKMKVHEPVPFFDRECLKITIRMSFCNVGSQIEAMKGAFGDDAKAVLDASIRHGFFENDVFLQVNEINAVLSAEEDPDKRIERLDSFMEMQGFERRKAKTAPVHAHLEEDEVIEYENPKVSDCFDIRALRTTLPVDVIVRMASKAGQKRLSLLLTGGSGTGKTAFAHYLARSLGKRIIVATPSQILQKWWGNTERNIRHLFTAAQESGSVLLFDEIDTYLGRRGDVTEVNQKHWTTIANTFLQEMEHFSGIMIGTTNMKENVDPAFIRRFNRIVDFSYPDLEAIRLLWDGYFPKYAVSQEKLDSIARTEAVGPGDFANLWDTCNYMEENEVSTDFIVSELLHAAEMRVGRKHRPMGFRIN